ncbi:hypothetical protein KCP77_18915 [Salmonella enterica subsp. enterica]|nr:hypothetical protein KCP77_18915 [Salmonella enterica subsp. enterica]
MFLVCMGADIQFKSRAESAEKGAAITFCEILPAADYWHSGRKEKSDVGLVRSVDEAITISAMTNSNSGLWRRAGGGVRR